MSKIALTPNASGTGTFTLAAPNSNTSRTITLPDEAGEVLVNGTTQNVGIGTSSPQGKLEVSGDVYINGGSKSADASLVIQAGAAGTDGVTLDTSYYGGGYGPLKLKTGGTERMRIDSSGNLLVGTTDAVPSNNSAGTTADNGIALGADGLLEVAAYKSTVNAGAVGYFNRTGTDGGIIDLRKDGTKVGSIASRAGVVTSMILDPRAGGGGLTGGGAALYPTDNAGSPNDGVLTLGDASNRFNNLYLSGGVYLGGTGAANKLDDYEEGTFTPFMRINNGVEGITYNQRGGSYTKIGNLVTVMVYLALSSKGTNVGDVTIDGLPFTAGNQLGVQTSFNGTCLPAYFSAMATNISTLQGWVAQGTTEMYLRHTDGSGNSSTQNTGNGNINNNTDFRFFITYMVA